jgi:putative membrane protein
MYPTTERGPEAMPHAGNPSVQMGARRTGMAYQRTRLAAERTLMSIIRTSLSLIGFGFTIFQVFSSAQSLSEVSIGANAPRNFGTALVALGIGMLVVGIVYHVHFMRALRADREEGVASGQIRGISPYPVSMTLVVACALLLIGILAISSMVFGVHPFG